MKLSLLRRASLVLAAVLDDWELCHATDEETEELVRLVVQMLVQIVEEQEEASDARDA